MDGVASSAPSRESVREELERSHAALRAMVTRSSQAQSRRRSEGTRWTNGRLLFEMLLGFLVVRALLPLVRWDGLIRVMHRTIDAPPTVGG